MEAPIERRYCKETGCTKSIRKTADKEAESVLYKSQTFTNFFYPSIECPSRLCDYHWRERWFAREEKEREVRLRKMKSGHRKEGPQPRHLHRVQTYRGGI